MRRRPPPEGQAAADGSALEARVAERLCYSLAFYREGELVGRAQLHWHDGATADIVDLYVVPEWRGQGLGKAIVRQCVAVARTLGARLITAHTSPHNRPAYRAFVALGFRPRDEEQHLELPLE